MKWFEASARQGKADAQNNLGGIFYNGLGVVQNYAEALKWWRLSAQQGNASAQTAIGDMYRDGLGTPKNDDEAFKWFQLSAQQGDSGAQNNLGVMYHEGRGVAKNDTEALRLLELSARQGNPVGQYDLEMFRSSGYIGANGYVAEIPLEKEGGTLVIPVLINNSIALKFIIDSGSADVSIPADVFLTLMRTGTIQDDDFLGQQTYRLADGSTVPSQTFRIRTLKVGNREIHDITGSIANVEGSLLLGQSFLARFESWSIDNQRQVLVLESGAPIK
jgi:TPR repeat protein